MFIIAIALLIVVGCFLATALTYGIVKAIDYIEVYKLSGKKMWFFMFVITTCVVELVFGFVVTVVHFFM